MTEMNDIYSAVYSGVPVCEMIVNSVAVMRRRTDSYMNATQILKVANIDKGKRTKILEKEVLNGKHEKVQGGYGKYQGTWIPFDKSKQLAEKYNVFEQLAPIFNFKLDNTPIQEGEDSLLTKEQAMIARKKLTTEANTIKHPRSTKSNNEQTPIRKKAKLSNVPTINTKRIGSTSSKSTANSLDEKRRNIMSAILLSDKPEQIKELITSAHGRFLNTNIVIDEHGNTTLHWATALARKDTLEFLVTNGANVTCKNNNGETPLMRAVAVTNNFDNNTFPKVLDFLKESITVLDIKRRSVFHHATLIAGIQGHKNAAIYYTQLLTEYIHQQQHLELKYILDLQDSLGDTALDIAIRLDCEPLINILLKAGAQQNISKGQTSNDDKMITKNDSLFTNPSYSLKPYIPSQRGKEIVATVQKIVNTLDQEYGEQLTIKEQELQKIQSELDVITKELEKARKGLEGKQSEAQELSETQQKAQNIRLSLQKGWEELNQTMSKSGKSVPCIDEVVQLDKDEDIDVLFTVPQLVMSITATEEEKKKQVRDHVKRIQATVKAYKVNNQALENEIKTLEEEYVKKETQCKKLIAACCSLPIEKIDNLVEPLILAIESDPPDLDLARIIGFMDKIRRQGTSNESGTSLTYPTSI